METAPIARRVQRIRHEVLQRPVTVTAIAIADGFATVTFSGEALADFASDGFDDHVKFVFCGDDGEPVKRDYTPRRFDRDARTLTIEFALHGPGAASDWTRQAQIGMAATIAGPKSSMMIPTDYAWHLLVGDTAAIPAIHRRLEELPADARVIVMIQTDDAGERRALPCAATCSIQWLDASEDLIAVVTALALPAGDGFAWCAGEASVMARLREVLAGKGVNRGEMRVAAYWKRTEANYHASIESGLVATAE